MEIKKDEININNISVSDQVNLLKKLLINKNDKISNVYFYFFQLKEYKLLTLNNKIKLLNYLKNENKKDIDILKNKFPCISVLYQMNFIVLYQI